MSCSQKLSGVTQPQAVLLMQKWSKLHQSGCGLLVIAAEDVIDVH